MLWSLALVAVLSSAEGRAVNISNTWVLPEEGFPVFYRYFRDRISWYEADAVCQFHHANLVTVDTTAQYDAVRAYLKELDISSAVWVGLIRSNPDGDFTWTDYRGMSGDGYWSAAPDSRSAPLCAAADPAADYRWEARACGGPMVASFICELPVPQWALGSEGCMVRALPALTVLYLPESAAVQLTTDCGLAGVKRVQCTGNVKRENLLGDLSCPYEPEESTTIISSEITTGSTDANTEQDIVQEVITEEIGNTTEHVKDVDQSIITTASPAIVNIEDKLNRIPLAKDIEFNTLLIHDNNLESNDIPKIANNDNNFLSEEDSEKFEDEKNKQHKMLHNELARQGNLGYFETIFSQPADHFVPPLVMAKAKMSDDMTVLSLEEKHAQQLAEHRVLKYKKTQQLKHRDPHTEEQIATEIVPITETPIISKPAVKSKDVKDKNYKYGASKKYIEKFGEAKTKNIKMQGKPQKYAEKVRMEIQTESTLKDINHTSTLALKTTTSNNEVDDDSFMDLSVIIKEPKVDSSSTVNPISTVKTNKVEITSSPKDKNILESSTSSSEKTGNQNLNQSEEEMTHEVIKITILNEEHPSAIPTVFEFTTRLPVSESSSSTVKDISTAAILIPTLPVDQELTITTGAAESISSVNHSDSISKLPIPVTDSIAAAGTEHYQDTTTTEHNKDSSTTDKLETTTFPPITDAISVSNKLATSTSKEVSPIKTDTPSSTTEINVIMNDTEQSNGTEFHEEEFEILHDNDEEGLPPVSDSIDDFQSPLLSAASEPLRRPARSRRPPPNQHKKFNPFRILG